MILDRLRRLLASESPPPLVLPPHDELLQLEDDTWEGQIAWSRGRSHVSISFVASSDGPSTLQRSQINSAIQRLESLDTAAREALSMNRKISLVPERFSLFAFAVGDGSDLEDGRCTLSFNHPDDPDSFFNVHFSEWVVDSVVRND